MPTTLRIKTPRNIRPCTVELNKDDLASFSSLSSSAASSSSTGKSGAAAGGGGSSNASRKPSASPSPVPSIKAEELEEEEDDDEEDEEEPMSLDEDSSLAAAAEGIKQEQQLDPLAAVTASLPSTTTFVSVDEADSSDMPSSSSAAAPSSSNVISIPDTDPLPHSMSNDLMAMVAGDLGGDGGGGKGGSSSERPRLQIKPMIKLQIQQTPGAAAVPSSSGAVAGRPQAPPLSSSSRTQDPGITLKKPSPGGKKGPGGAGGGKGSGGGADGGGPARKPQREYHPDRHCGVWDNDNRRHCTRALTCKSHSVVLKRKVEGRSRNFDELVAEHKAVKESQALAAAAAQAAKAQTGGAPAAAATASPATAQQQQQRRGSVVGLTSPPINVESVLSGLAEPADPGGITIARPKGQPPSSSPLGVVGGWSPLVAGGTVKGVRLSSGAGGSGSSPLPKRLLGAALRESDENLHYTVDHPRPLAVCSLGSRRIGGLYVSDRGQILTR